jgi:catechol 2,3-dioxygenase-like lactoylglutathione lyase family enzyme
MKAASPAALGETMSTTKALMVLAASLAASLTMAPSAVRAQLMAKGPVINGHHHLNVSDVDAHMRFWVDNLGGKRGTFGNGAPIVMFPDALVFMREQAPTGGSIGSTVDHVGFSVPDIRATVDRLIAAGYTMVTAEQSPPGSEVVNGVRIVPGNGPVSGVAYVLGPDDVKVEVLGVRGQEKPIVSHHIHFFGDEAAEMRQWYVDVFGAEAQPDRGTGFITANLPGLGMNYTDTDAATAATSGRVIDHIGFEVDDLKGFIAGLEAKGIELDVPYREIPAANLAIAFLTDPWGTYIELTEGLDKIM